MKKIINKKCYDTEKAKSVGYWTNSGDSRDAFYVAEELFQKSNGEFFLFGRGGMYTEYANAMGGPSCSSGSRITVLAWDEARQWAEDRLDGDSYEKIFGEVAEDDSQTIIPVSLPKDILARAKHNADQAGISLSAYFESLIR